MVMKIFNQLEKLILEAKSSDMEDVLYDFDDFSVIHIKVFKEFLKNMLPAII